MIELDPAEFDRFSDSMRRWSADAADVCAFLRQVLEEVRSDPQICLSDAYPAFVNALEASEKRLRMGTEIIEALSAVTVYAGSQYETTERIQTDAINRITAFLLAAEASLRQEPMPYQTAQEPFGIQPQQNVLNAFNADEN